MFRLTRTYVTSREETGVSLYVGASRRYKLGSALMAFLLWGSWAWYANGADNEWHTLLSAIAQGSSSFFITLGLVALVSRLYHHFEHPLARVWLPAVIVTIFSSSLLLVVHLGVGTQQILQTILPPSTVAFLFCLFTSVKMQKNNTTGS
jgi:hypothetical protein